MTTFTYMRVDDWAVLYADGSVYNEGHSLGIDDLPDDEPIILKSYNWVEGPLGEWVSEHGGFPATLREALQIMDSK